MKRPALPTPLWQYCCPQSLQKRLSHCYTSRKQIYKYVDCHYVLSITELRGWTEQLSKYVRKHMDCKIIACQQYVPIYLAWIETERHYREKADTSGVSIPSMTLSMNLASRPFVFTLFWHCSFPCVSSVSLLFKLLLRHLGFFETDFLSSALELCIFDLRDGWTETSYLV